MTQTSRASTKRLNPVTAAAVSAATAALAASWLLTAVAAAAPLSLEEAIETARRNNPDLSISRQQVVSSEGSALSSHSGLLPSARLDAGFRQNKSAEVVDPNTGQRYSPFSEFFSAGASVSQNLIHPPAYFRYRAAQKDLSGARQGYRASEADLVYQVRQQYFFLLRAILLEKVMDEALAVSDEQLHRSETLFELGSVARTDVLQARVNRASAVQDQINARNSVAQERARLAVLLGMSAQDSLEIRTDVADPPEMTIEEGALMSEAAERPEVRRADADLAAARFRNRSAFWSQFPTLSGSLFYNRQVDALASRSDAFKDVFDLGDMQKNASWGFSIGLDWNLFDGLGTIGEVKSTRASVAAAREGKRREALAAELAVREAEVAIRNAREGIVAAKESVDFAEENLRLQQALYENGGGTILELNNAQVERTRAHNSFVDARIGLHLALAQLDRALGRR